jgi:hypothetical protein
MRKKLRARVCKSVSEQEPKNPEVAHANINIGVDIIDEKPFFVIECPSCKTVFGLELKIVLKLIKQAMSEAKQNGNKGIGRVV